MLKVACAVMGIFGNLDSAHLTKSGMVDFGILHTKICTNPVSLQLYFVFQIRPSAYVSFLFP